MTKQAARRNVVALVMVPAAFLLGLVLAVVVAGTASADSPLPTTSTSGTTTTSSTDGLSTGGFDQNSPQAQFQVINGTVDATSDHEIVGSSAFPNYTTGAVDNYYSLARSYMDNSPFSEGTASPADTGPVGQTAAAGNAQQPQYADARWPGGPATANYGNTGQPSASAGAYEQLAQANASEASNGLSSPGLGGSKTLPVPKGFDKKLQAALAGWKSKYLGCPTVPKASKSPLPTVPSITVPTVKTPTTTTVTTPLGTVTTPSLPSAPKSVSTPSTRSLSAASSNSCSTGSGSGSDGESLLESSSLAVLVPGTADTNKDINKVDTKKLETTPTTTATTTTDTNQTTTTGDGSWTPKPYTLMMHGTSSVGRVSLGGGQIVIKGISVEASVENDGTASPTYKANVTVASASIGGVPVTIDQDGVHLASQTQALPYKQASDSLNGALKQAGIQIFLVAPQVTNCSQSSGSTSTSTTTTTTTDTTSTDQSGACAQTGAIGGSCTDTSTDTTSTSTSSTDTTTSSTPTPAPPLPAGSGGTDTTSTAVPACPPPPPSSCDTGTTSTGNSTTTGNTTTTGATPTTPALGGSTTNSTTTTSSTSTTDTTSIGPSSSCSAPPTSCPTTSTGTTGTTSTTSTDTTGTAGAPNPMGGAGATGGQQTIVMATGVHIVFTQPVSPSGVPAQFVEHILGEVFVNSLATPAPPLPAVAPFGAAGSSSSSCSGVAGAKSSKASSGGGGSSSSSAGGTSGGGVLGSSSGSGAVSPTGSSYAASSPTGAGGGSQSFPAAFARALKKPLWLLLAYLVWQLLVIGTGWSLWNWRRGEHT